MAATAPVLKGLYRTRRQHNSHGQSRSPSWQPANWAKSKTRLWNVYRYDRSIDLWQTHGLGQPQCSRPLSPFLTLPQTVSTHHFSFSLGFGMVVARCKWMPHTCRASNPLSWPTRAFSRLKTHFYSKGDLELLRETRTPLCSLLCPGDRGSILWKE